MGPDGLKLNELHYRGDDTHWSTWRLTPTDRADLARILGKLQDPG